MTEFDVESLRFEKHTDAIEHFYDVKNDALRPGQTNAIIMTYEGKLKTEIGDRQLLRHLMERVNELEEEITKVREAAE